MYDGKVGTNAFIYTLNENDGKKTVLMVWNNFYISKVSSLQLLIPVVDVLTSPRRKCNI